MNKLNPYQLLQFLLVVIVVLCWIGLGVALVCGVKLPAELSSLFASGTALIFLLISPQDLAAAIKQAAQAPPPDVQARQIVSSLLKPAPIPPPGL